MAWSWWATWCSPILPPVSQTSLTFPLVEAEQGAFALCPPADSGTGSLPAGDCWAEDLSMCTCATSLVMVPECYHCGAGSVGPERRPAQE
jgi:hypothetical protein